MDVTLDVEDPKVVTFETEEPGLVAAAKGKIDAFLAAEPGWAAPDRGGRAAEGDPRRCVHLLPSGFVDKSSGLEVQAFVHRVNEIIQGFQADGTLKRLSMKWFGKDYAREAADFDIDAVGQTVK